MYVDIPYMVWISMDPDFWIFKVIQLLRSVRKIIQDQHIYVQMGGSIINYSKPNNFY